MFKSLDELIRFNRTRFQLVRAALVRAVSGIVLAAAGFQAVYSLLFAFE
jgi:hypothetical protein